MEFEIKIFTIFFNFRTSKIIYHDKMGCNVTDIYKKVVDYNAKN
jgi:hypothetical protein